MGNYELTIVLSGKATAAKIKSIKEKIDKFVSFFKGKINKVDEWGKLELAYKIEGNSSGNFLLYNIELEPGNIKSLSDKLKMEEEIIRYLLIKK
jgi:small subunit ribosomal protein S6